jgi:hypothetical protein
MPDAPAPTLLCLASYLKGERFLQAAKQLGCRVLLLTAQRTEHEPWPREHLDGFYVMPSLMAQPDVTYAVSYLARTEPIDRIVPLDEYDTQMAASLREHLRLPGLGETQARFFRDKLAMRLRAEAAGLRVPAFVHVLNYDRLRDFMARVPPPWVLKPRSEASAMGIKRIDAPDALWPELDRLGDKQSFFLLEQYVAGAVYHVDAVVWDGAVVFTAAHRYARPPMDVYQGGGVFATQTLPYDGDERMQLDALTRRLLRAFGHERGVAHTEFIRSDADGQFFFLETAARVGGAGIDRLVEAEAGFNLWDAWAQVEACAARGTPYTLPEARRDYAGLLVCLAHQEDPDLSAYDDPEVVWRLRKKHHAGLLLASPDATRVAALVESYSQRFAEDFLMVQPPRDHAPE